MKILFVNYQPPLPLDAGSKIRAYHLLKSYTLNHEVTLVYFVQGEEKREDILTLSNLCKKVYRIPAEKEPSFAFRGKFRIVRKLSKFFSLTPYLAIYLVSAKMRDTVEEAIREEEYDVVHLNGLYLLPNVTNILKKGDAKFLTLVNLDDLESEKLMRLADIEPLFSAKRYFNYMESLKFHFYEKKISDFFNVTLVCSGRDRNILKEKGVSTKIEVIPNGVTVRADIPEVELCGAGDVPVILFLGTMSYKPNEDAALYFFREIFPLIKNEVSSARFVIAGASPGEKICALHNGTDIVVTGRVEDVVKQYSGCTISIAPIRAGGGTRIKILEAMSAGKAVVSTSIGCEGIEVIDGENIVIADNPKDFAEKSVALLKDKMKRESIGSKGRQLVRDKYDWLSIGNRLNQILADYAQNRN